MPSLLQSTAEILAVIQRDINSITLTDEEKLGNIQLYISQCIYGLETEKFDFGTQLGGVPPMDQQDHGANLPYTSHVNQAKLDLLQNMLAALEDTDTIPLASDRLKALHALINNTFDTQISAPVQAAQERALASLASEANVRIFTSVENWRLGVMEATRAEPSKDTKAIDPGSEQKQDAEVKNKGHIAAHSPVKPSQTHVQSSQTSAEDEARRQEMEERRRREWYDFNCD